ncbi:U-scoloptoxin(01)-Er1a-like [Ornithodoros turicata]|uniref:U-scoloptoxin(01)-Er1a-like n=1 Tax=Ornithodoros turicata TaxID=34597 RepID=UPI003138B8CE
MKTVIVAVVALAAVATSLPRAKRAAYELPDGVEFLVGPVKTSFQCPARVGYFADVDNNCQIFHVCNPVPKDDGSVEVQQYSFLCGNQTVFSQFSLTCTLPEDAVPCRSSPDFFYLNDKIGQEKVDFHDESDVQRAVPLIPRYQQAAATNVKEVRVPFFKA